MSVVDLINLKVIRKRRQALNLTQSELAALSGISQSALNKIENERISPSLNTLTKIFGVLEEKEHEGEKKAKDVMHCPVICFKETDTVQRASELAKARSISQFPVLKVGAIVGSISTNGILTAKKGAKLAGFIEPAFPTFGPETPVSIIISVLKYAKAALVLEKGKIKGIITPEDLL